MAKRTRIDRGLYRAENKDGSVNWMIDYLNPDKKRIRKTFSTKKQAVAELDERRSLVNKGEYSEFVKKKEQEMTTFGELVELYKQNYQDQTSYKTGKKSYIEGYKEYFKEDTPLSSIDYGRLKTYRNTLKKSLNQHGKLLSASSVNNKMSCLRHMFKEAIEYGMIDRSPFSGGKTLMLKVDNVRERYLAPEEIHRLLDKSPVHLKSIIKCGLFSGMRLGNILNLKWSQIRDGHIYVKTKTGNESFPVSDALAEVFDQIKAQKISETVINDGNAHNLKFDYVFTYNGKPVKSVKTAFRKACKDAGLDYGRDKSDGVTFHTLRHTYGTYLAKQGTHIRTIQELMGHKSIKMTQRYTKVADDSKRQAVNGLSYDL